MRGHGLSGPVGQTSAAPLSQTVKTKSGSAHPEEDSSSSCCEALPSTCSFPKQLMCEGAPGPWDGCRR